MEMLYTGLETKSWSQGSFLMIHVNAYYCGDKYSPLTIGSGSGSGSGSSSEIFFYSWQY